MRVSVAGRITQGFLFNKTMGVVMSFSMDEVLPGSIGNNRQPLASVGAGTPPVQGQLALLAEVAPLHRLGEANAGRMDFSACLSHAALHLGLADAQIADEIHICRGYMSRFMRSVAQGWATRLVAFMRTTQSLAPLEWLAFQMGCELVPRANNTARIRALEAELAALTGRAERAA
jgi:hypothetical protein